MSQGSNGEQKGAKELSAGMARGWQVLFWGLVAFALMYNLYHPLGICQDNAVYLSCAQRLLDGQLPYVDILDANPPLIMYLNVIPVLLARLLSVHVVLVFSTLIMLLALWSTLIIKRIIRASSFDVDPIELEVFLLLWFLLTLCLRIFNLYHYGQREHLFVLLYFPYFLLRCSRSEGGAVSLAQAVVLGFAAGIGVSLKPHFVLIFLVCELWWLVRQRSFRDCFQPEVYACVGTGMAYVIHFLLIPEAMRQSFFNWWLPIIVKGYQLLSIPLAVRLANPMVWFCFAAVLLSLLFTKSKNKGFARLLLPLAVFTITANLAFILQSRSCSYHTLPAFFGAILSLSIALLYFRPNSFANNTGWFTRGLVLKLSAQVIVLLSYLYSIMLFAQSRDFLFLLIALWVQGVFLGIILLARLHQYTQQGAAKQTSQSISVVIALLIVGVINLGLVLKSNQQNSENTLISKNDFCRFGNLDQYREIASLISSHTKEEDSILFIDETLQPAYPLLEMMNRRHASRYIWSEIMAVVFRLSAGERELANQLLSRYVTDIAEDIAKNRPKLIFIDNQKGNQGCPPDFDYLSFLTERGFVRRAMKDYKELQTVPDFMVFKRLSAHANGLTAESR